jgi:uncharacterized protein (DUF1015 family)
MAVIRPFSALRPIPQRAAQVASPPYDVLEEHEARQLAQANPDSFVHVIRAEVDLDPAMDSYAPLVYAKAAETLQQMRANGVLVQDQTPCLYVYKQVMAGRAQTGLVACTAVDDYLAGAIKIHEQTRPAKVEDRRRYIEACQAHTGLIFLTYRPRQDIQQIVDAWTNTHPPLYDFQSDDAVQHSVWVIQESAVIRSLQTLFNTVDALYVADGHHRTASAAEAGKLRRTQQPDYTGAEAFNYFLSVLFPSDHLTILGYNRVVKDLNGLSRQAFLDQVAQTFELAEAASAVASQPTERHTFGMYVGGRWYQLWPKPGTYNEADPVKRLDVSILQHNLLTPVLGIHDPRTDDRIEFVGGIRGRAELERRVNTGEMQAAFALAPTRIEDVMTIADAGRLMPPKSTWFEPKLRGGLLIHLLS